MNHPIPDQALDDRLGFLGTSGSGKTYGAGTAIERLLSRNSRVIISDPLGVWFGLRLNAEGTAPSGYDVVIFGGERGDLPLNEHAGALIGETIAGMKESAILDLSDLGTKAAERRFMLGFLTALYRHASKEPVHVVFDEADLWAPQQIRDREQEPAKLLGMMETIVRRGRVKGFIPWLISQRPAVINKDVLSQVDGLIAFKLTSSQDRDQLGDWIKGQADVQQGKAILASLPTLDRGDAVIWVPGHGILTTASFPKKTTFDSSRTPRRSEVVQTVALKPIDLSSLKLRLAEVQEETKANDPKELKAEIARLRGELAKSVGKASPQEITDAENRGYLLGRAAGRSAAYDAFSEAGYPARKVLDAAISDSVNAFIRSIAQAIDMSSSADVAAPSYTLDGLLEGMTEENRHDEIVMYGTTTPKKALETRRWEISHRTTSPSDDRLPGAAGKLLAAMDTNPPVLRTWGQFAALAGLRARGGHYNTGRKHLLDAGLVVEEGGLVRIAKPSADASEPILDPEENVKIWTSVLSGAAPAILEDLFAVGGSSTKQNIADRLGLVPKGGHWNTGWKQLRDNGIVSLSGDVATLTELFHPKMRAAA